MNLDLTRAYASLTETSEAIAALDKGSLEALGQLVADLGPSQGTLWTMGNGGSSSTGSHMACDVGKGLSYPIEGLQRRFAPGRRPVRVTLAPALGLFRPLGFYLSVGLPFKAAKRAFTQTFVQCNAVGGNARVRGDRLGGAVGALKITGVNVVNAAVCECQAHPLRLPLAMVIERDVELPLNTGVNVPSSFALANCSNANRGCACVGHGLVTTVGETSMNTGWGCGCAFG